MELKKRDRLSRSRRDREPGNTLNPKLPHSSSSHSGSRSCSSGGDAGKTQLRDRECLFQRVYKQQSRQSNAHFAHAAAGFRALMFRASASTLQVSAGQYALCPSRPWSVSPCRINPLHGASSPIQLDLPIGPNSAGCRISQSGFPRAPPEAAVHHRLRLGMRETAGSPRGQPGCQVARICSRAFAVQLIGKLLGLRAP